jgi:hypothetical protein
VTRSRILLFVVGSLFLGVSAVSAQGQRERTGPPGPAGDSEGPCATVGTITALPFTDNTLDTCSGTAAISDYANATCNSVMYPGPELVYEIQVASGNTDITMTLTPAAADLGIFLLGTCGVGTSCIAFNDSIGGGVASDISQNNPAGADMIPSPLAPASYFIYIDSYYATGGMSWGGFTLDVMGTLPVELLSFEID